MGCASSQVAGQIPVVFEPTENATAPTKYPPAEAFEIALNDNTLQPSGNSIDGDSGGNKIDSLIKKHPPIRLQKLILEQSIVTPTTIEHLEEKLAKAEIRRQQYLQQKIDTVLTLAQPNRQDDCNNDDDKVTTTTTRTTTTKNHPSPGDGTVD